MSDKLTARMETYEARLTESKNTPADIKKAQLLGAVYQVDAVVGEFGGALNYKDTMDIVIQSLLDKTLVDLDDLGPFIKIFEAKREHMSEGCVVEFFGKLFSREGVVQHIMRELAKDI